MHQDLLQLQACQNPLDDQKYKSLRLWYYEITLIDVSGHVDPKLSISWERFWAIIFSLDRNDINNFGPKGQPFKTILTWEEMLQSERSSMICIVARSRQTMRTIKRKSKKKKTKTKEKEKLIVMSCHALEKFDWVQTKIKKAKLKKNWKKWKTAIFFSYKELLFSSGNYVWDEKLPSFIILSLI